MSAERLILDCALQAENERLRDELTAANLDLASAKLLIDRIDEVAAFPADGADVGRRVRLHNIRDKISIYRRDDRGRK